MVVLNHMSRYHLADMAIRFALPDDERAHTLRAELRDCIDNAVQYTRDHFEDPPEIRDWAWTQPDPG
jgi:xylulose-5-phosphate/fructose-6-phosphate phosphoketolase